MHDVARRSRKQTRARGKKRIRANRCRPSWRSPQTRTRTERTIENPIPRSEAKPEDAGKGRCVSGSGNAGAMAITDEGCRIPSRPGLISTATYPTADIARWREGTSPHSNRLNAQRCSMAVSTERYPIADIARWREGTFPHSNELNAERRSKGYKSEPGSEVKTDPHQLTPTVPASTLDARRSWDGSMTHPDDAPPPKPHSSTGVMRRSCCRIRCPQNSRVADRHGPDPPAPESTAESTADFLWNFWISNPPHDE